MAYRSDAQDQTVFPYRWTILAFSILAYGTSQFSRLNFAGIQRFVADDLSLDRGAIGLLASVFFYSYAVFQMPWGIASDRFGSRSVVALGIALTALTMVGFASGQTEGSLVFWRLASGIAAAAVYVPLTGGIARWFSERERSFSQGTLGGVGGTLGEAAAYFLLPVLAVYFASGWRQGTNIIAGAIGVIAILCVVFLSPRPPATRPRRENRSTGRCFGTRSCGAMRSSIPDSSWGSAERRHGSPCTSPTSISRSTGCR
jgi:sugar phosphate permease